MNTLRTHTVSFMTNRFNFWNSKQNPHTCVQDWGTKVRQAESLFGYEGITGQMCRAKNWWVK